MIATRLTALAVAAALPFLSGCVAAAIPVLAAGGLATTQVGGPTAPADNRPRVAIPGESEAATSVDRRVGPVGGMAPGPIVRDYTFADGSQVTVTNAMGTEALGSPPARPPRDKAGSETTAGITYLAGVTSLPAPAPGALPMRSATPSSGYAEFTEFARAQASIPAAGSERFSAILADSSRLSSETRACSIHPAAVLIDLDPLGELLDVDRPLAADPSFAMGLAQLRRDGIEIGWVSGRTADRAGAIRKALAAAGLDPEGRDQLVLLRFPEERKQTRRDDFAKAHCVVAIAGDERADFDELFTYLRDPATATQVDALIGQRWFFIPSPVN